MERVASALREAAVDARLEEFPGGTPTADAAAKAAGCSAGQIVKSLVFMCDDRPVLALLPGDRRADVAKVAAAASAARARVATPQEVVAATGFEPGAVSPLPVAAEAKVLIERRLLLHELVWIGAGSARHMAAISPLDLLRLTHADQSDLAE